MKKILYITIPLALLLTSYLVSGRRTNPPIENDVVWASPEAKQTFQRACADCHSHETRWPWYSRFAPISWRVIDHVEEGREHFNISTRVMGDSDEAAESVAEGEMPLKDYLWLHPEAKLSPAEQDRFATELLATFGGKMEGHKDKHEHSDDDDSSDD